MTDREYKRLRRKLEQELSEIRETYVKKFDALDTVYKMAKELDSPAARRPRLPKGALSQAVEIAVATKMSAPFTVTEMREAVSPIVGERLNARSVAGVLRKLVRERRLRIHRPGTPVEPTIYVRATPGAPTASGNAAEDENIGRPALSGS